MPDLLLELFSEEIPARMQAGAARDLERLTVGALSDRGLLFEGIKAFAGPRRLTLAVSGLPANDERVVDIIRLGRKEMPGYSQTLNQQDIQELLAYLHTL